MGGLTDLQPRSGSPCRLDTFILRLVAATVRGRGDSGQQHPGPREGEGSRRTAYGERSYGPGRSLRVALELPSPAQDVVPGAWEGDLVLFFL